MTAAKRTGDTLSVVLNNLNRQIGNIKQRSSAGLLAAGLLVQRGAQKKVPVLTGNLKGSAYTRKVSAHEPAVEVGFTAAYAIYVHENLEAHHDNGEAKFLERSLNENRREILALIARGGG